MKIKVKSAFYDNNGIHKVGDIVEVEPRTFDAQRMEEIKSEPKTETKKAKK